ncbi:hypothetical protein [Acinetobacter indicus]|nr:hypothetical protein [Acinetobacter indicus]
MNPLRMSVHDDILFCLWVISCIGYLLASAVNQINATCQFLF